MSGALCISIDFELGWGIWDKPNGEYFSRCAADEEAIVRRLVEIFDEYDASATWAIVGRLLERDAHAAATTKYGDRVWFAPDLVDIVRRAKTPQDIGSHSFAHVYFRESTREALREDLAAARRVHDEHGLPFTSFVFPRNQVAHLDLLKDAGLKVFRSVDHGWHWTVHERVGGKVARLANLVDKMLPIPPSVVKPIRHDNGLVELPSSMLLLGRNGLRRMIAPASIVAKARFGLESARRNHGIFHLWFHPANFFYDVDRQFEILVSILDSARNMRGRGELEIRTMSSYAGSA